MEQLSKIFDSSFTIKSSAFEVACGGVKIRFSQGLVFPGELMFDLCQQMSLTEMI